MKPIRIKCWHCLKRDRWRKLGALITNKGREINPDDNKEGQVKLALELEYGGLWRDGKPKEWQRGNWGLIATAAANTNGIPNDGAVHCLGLLLKRFSGTDACSIEQLSKAFFEAAFKGRTHVLNIIRKYNHGQFAYWRPLRNATTDAWEITPSYQVVDVADLGELPFDKALEFWCAVSDGCVTQYTSNGNDDKQPVAMFSINRGKWTRGKKQALIRLLWGDDKESLCSLHTVQWDNDAILELDFVTEDEGLFMNSELFVEEIGNIVADGARWPGTQCAKDYCLQIIAKPQQGRMRVVDIFARTPN